MNLSQLRKSHDQERFEMRQRLTQEGVDRKTISALMTDKSREQLAEEAQFEWKLKQETRERQRQKLIEREAAAQPKEKKKKPSLDHPRAALSYRLRTKFDMTLEEYDSMVDRQGGRCLICQDRFDRKKRIAVDHCHRSGRVRGLLCAACNSILGFSYDNEDILQRAILYLRGDLDKDYAENDYSEYSQVG